MNTLPKTLSERLWDFFCVVSLIGIWPRFIEPNLLHTTQLSIKLRDLPEGLQGLKILQLSDLHLNPSVSSTLLEKLKKAYQRFSPDLVVWTGDLLCYGKMKDPDRLRELLKNFKAPLGQYAILGNHDYAEQISLNEEGNYDLKKTDQVIHEGFRRLLRKHIAHPRKVTLAAQTVPPNPELVALFKECQVTLLHNECHRLSFKGAPLNLVGLGEYTAGRCLPDQAFMNRDPQFATLVLAHNPDSLQVLKDRPADLILAGHTHGGQINLPWIWQKLCCMELPQYKKGLHHIGKSALYVSRGIGSPFAFRWFASPEVVCITLEKA